MASFKKDLLGKTGGHVVGQIESWTMDTVINGAVAKADIDNFTLGELVYENGEAFVKQATATVKAEDAVLICTPEERLEGEPLENFYNATGERVTCAILKQNFQFSTSAVADDITAVGQVAVWDATAKKFKKAGAEATDSKMFRVVEIEDDAMYSIDGKKLVSLNVIK